MTGTGDVATWTCVSAGFGVLPERNTARLIRLMMRCFRPSLPPFADRRYFRPDVFPHLLLRLERSGDAAQNAVDHIDRAALSRKRAITRSFVASIIDDLTPA